MAVLKDAPLCFLQEMAWWACAQTKDDVIKWSLLDESTRAYRLPTPEELVSHNVVVATCSAAALLGEGKFQTHLHYKPVASSGGTNWEMSAGITFTHVLIDEAGQVHPFCTPASVTGLGME